MRKKQLIKKNADLTKKLQSLCPHESYRFTKVKPQWQPPRGEQIDYSKTCISCGAEIVLTKWQWLIQKEEEALKKVTREIDAKQHIKDGFINKIRRLQDEYKKTPEWDKDQF